jgi:hypothetical protein
MRHLHELPIEPLHIVKAFLEGENHLGQSHLADLIQHIRGNPNMRKGRMRCMRMNNGQDKKGRETQ